MNEKLGLLCGFTNIMIGSYFDSVIAHFLILPIYDSYSVKKWITFGFGWCGKNSKYLPFTFFTLTL